MDELEKLESFKKELKALLVKYDATIYWTCGDGSDLWGIYDEKMKVWLGEKSYTLTDYDSVISQRDL